MRFRNIWIIVASILALILAGCQAESTNTAKEVKQVGEEELRQKAVQHIKETYHKEFEVTKVECVRKFGASCFIRGKVKDGKNTEITVYWLPPDGIKDDYVLKLWNKELEPEIKSLSERTMEIREIETISYSNGAEESKYKGEVPSVFEVLKNGGDKDYSFHWRGEIYQHKGRYEEEIKQFLKEIKAMNFNDVLIVFFVYDDQLKTSSENEEEDNYLLYRYNISEDDIQKIDIDNLNLDQYKTVIKH
ncbi:MAG: hypothetical protein WB502_02380 [Thermoactinomyces sp.]